MTTQIATTPEQSARMKACGVDPESADMFYTNYRTKPNAGIPLIKISPFGIREDLTPAWSFSALLALIPPCLYSPMGTEYRLELSTLRIHTEFEVQWFSGHDRWHPTDKNGRYVRLWDKSPIEACVKAIEWLTLKGIKLNYNHDTDRN